MVGFDEGADYVVSCFCEKAVRELAMLLAAKWLLVVIVWFYFPFQTKHWPVLEQSDHSVNLPASRPTSAVACLRQIAMELDRGLLS